MFFFSENLQSRWKFFHTSGEGWLDCKHCVRSKMHRKKVHLINLLSSLVPRKLLHEIIRARGSMVPKAGCGIGGLVTKTLIP